MKMKFRTTLFPLLLAQMAFCNISQATDAISLEQVTKDVTFLASDSMAGRASFTPEIDKAADYIAKRFAQIGLSPLEGQKDFKQSFELFQTKVETINVTLEGKSITPSSLMLLSKRRSINWDNTSQVKSIIVGENEDFRAAMRLINQEKQDLIVFVNEKHQQMFNRFQSHFSRGSLGFESDTGFSAVFVLTSESKIDNWSIKATSSIEAKQLTNVVGLLKGKSKASETVLFSSHYDHLGSKDGKSGEQDNIFNGADDDASGTTAVINLAEYFASKNNQQRTLVFAAFTAEEIGGYGSKFFSESIDPIRITAMINVEMIGKVSKFGEGQLWMTGADKSNLFDILNQSLKSHNKQVHVDPYPKQNLFYRSDNATLAKFGVPAHSFSSSQIDQDQHYHQVSDDIASLNIESMHQVIQSLAESVETLVDGSQTPHRLDTSKIESKGSFY